MPCYFSEFQYFPTFCSLCMKITLEKDNHDSLFTFFGPTASLFVDLMHNINNTAWFDFNSSLYE